MGYWNMLPNTITVNTKGIITGSHGNSYGWTALATNVPANVQPLKDTVKLFNDQRKVETEWKIFVTQSIAAGPGDQFIFGSVTGTISYVRNLDSQCNIYEIHGVSWSDFA